MSVPEKKRFGGKTFYLFGGTRTKKDALSLSKLKRGQGYTTKTHKRRSKHGPKYTVYGRLK